MWDPRELAGYGLGEPRTTEPGTAYVDSDAGYVLLGLALERATGRTAPELIQSTWWIRSTWSPRSSLRLAR